MSAQIIPFPGAAADVVQNAVAVAARAITEVGALASPRLPVVQPIRKGVRAAKKPRADDEQTATFARLAASYAKKAHELAQTEPGSEQHRFTLHMQGIDSKLPRNNLRCIVSTLDEERDFDLRCAEVEILHAEYTLESRRIDRVRVLETAPWWESPTLKPLVDANNCLWDRYRAEVLKLAETPAHTYPRLERKRRIVGKTWLQAEGEWYDRLRSAVAADEAWLAENRPKRRRAAR